LRAVLCLLCVVSLTEATGLGYVSSHSASGRSTTGRLGMRLGSCPPPQLPQPGPSRRSMRRMMATPLPILLTLILLPPLAFASPPDPSWVAGSYDGADGDDIVILVYETSAAKTVPSSHLGPRPCQLEMSLEDIGGNVPDRYFTRGPRSPPVLCSREFTHVFNSLPLLLQGLTLPPASRRSRVSLCPPDDLPVLCLSGGSFNRRMTRGRRPS
jgi:hypothetical protein